MLNTRKVKRKIFYLQAKVSTEITKRKTKNVEITFFVSLAAAHATYSVIRTAKQQVAGKVNHIDPYKDLCKCFINLVMTTEIDFNDIIP